MLDIKPTTLASRIKALGISNARGLVASEGVYSINVGFQRAKRKSRACRDGGFVTKLTYLWNEATFPLTRRAAISRRIRAG